METCQAWLELWGSLQSRERRQIEAFIPRSSVSKEGMGYRGHNPHKWLCRLQNYTQTFACDQKGNFQQEIPREKVGMGNQQRPKVRAPVGEACSSTWV